MTVIGRSDRALRRVPGSATVLSERDLQRQRPWSVSEALRPIPGVTVRDEDGYGLRPNISFRGLDGTRSRRVLLLEDGIPVVINPYNEPDAYYHPPIDRMARVEAIRGSGSILYGPQTIGGVLNYVTAAPPLREAASLQASAGERGYLGFHGSYGNTIGPVGFLVQAMFRRGDGFRSQPFTLFDLFGKLRVALPSGELVLRGGFYLEGANTTYVGLTQGLFERDPNYNPVPNDRMQVNRYHFAAIYTHNFSPAVSLRTTFFGYTTQRNWSRAIYDRTRVPGVDYFQVVGDEGIPGGAIYFRQTPYNKNRNYEVAGLESRLQANHRFSAAARLEVDAGARVLYEHALRRLLVGHFVADRSGTPEEETDANGLALAAYAQARLILWDRLHLVPGVRVENYTFENTTRRIANQDSNAYGTGNNFAVVPGASLAYVRDAFSLFAGVHRGYAPPRISSSINIATGNDRLLDAEYSVNYELGGRVGLGNWLRAEAALFAIDFRNELIPATGASGTSELVNAGASRYLGLEAQASLDLGRALRWPTSVYLNARYTGVDARFVGGANDGHFVPYAVPHTLNAAVGFEHPFGLSAQVAVNVVSSHFSDAANTERGSANGLVGIVPTFHNLDIVLRYQHRPTGVGFAFTVKNVENQPYIAGRLPEGIQPGGFRQVLFSMRWDWDRPPAPPAQPR